METLELIRTRKSVRTFDGNGLPDDTLQRLIGYCRTIPDPFGIPVEFVLLDAEKHGLSSPVITGEHWYIAAKVKKTAHCEEAFGFAFEKMVLFAWSLGIGTTWIGGTMKRQDFEKAVNLADDEIMPCISPLGIAAKKRSVNEIGMRTAIRADKRMADKELFFADSFAAPLTTSDTAIRNALEAVRLAPSAVNKQPWRIVKCADTYHFYEHRTIGGGAAWDVQKVDMGIALCHFMEILGGTLTFAAPDLEVPKGLEYIASVTAEN